MRYWRGLADSLYFVIAGLVPATHTLRAAVVRMGGRDKPGHDGYKGGGRPKLANLALPRPIRY